MKEKKCAVCKKMVDEEEMFWAVDEDKEICKKCYEREWKEGIGRRVMPLKGGAFKEKMLEISEEWIEEKARELMEMSLYYDKGFKGYSILIPKAKEFMRSIVKKVKEG